MNFDAVRPSMGNTTTVVDPTEQDKAEKASLQSKLKKEIREVEMLYEAEIKSFVDRRTR